MIYYLPIEPLEERYTEQWYRWFPEEFRRQGKAFTIIDGEPLSAVIETGTFLDVNSTLHYKAHQLKAVAKLFFENKVQQGDTFFIADVEFWGIDAIRYLATLNKLDVKMCGFVHAGSYTRGDFMAPCAPFAEYYERAWGVIFNKLFVGSFYHKARLVCTRGISPEKIYVSGNPYDMDELQEHACSSKRKRVIHTNRPDPEKSPDKTLEVFARLKQECPDVELLLTTSRARWGDGALRDRALAMQREGILSLKEGLSKAEYLDLLAESQVMTGNSIEENFGYCVLEAMALDTIPIVPNAFSHPELLDEDKRCLFNSFDQQLALIQSALAAPFSVAHHAGKYKHSLELIVQALG